MILTTATAENLYDTLSNLPRWAQIVILAILIIIIILFGLNPFKKEED